MSSSLAAAIPAQLGAAIMKSDFYDVIVIGAGVAGSMTALLAARRGLRTLLVERQSFPRHKVCGCCLNARAVAMLQQADLWTRLQQFAPAQTSSLAIRCRGTALNVPMPSGTAISRYRFDQWLSQEAVAAGAELIENTVATVFPLEPVPDEFMNEDAGLQQTRISAGRLELITHREVELKFSEPDAERSIVRSKVVVACDGLGHPSLSRLPDYHADSVSGSRIGLGAVFPKHADDSWMESGTILMAVAPHGYAGLVEIENQQLNLAAAVDPSHLNGTKSPFATVRSIFDLAGVALPQALPEALFKGTLPLTRSASRITGPRLILLGDSTGYIEPFTGEGMAWALSAATSVIPFLQTAVNESWTRQLESEWVATFRRVIRHEQWICRFLSGTLRRSWLLPPLMATCRRLPSVTQFFVRQINKSPL
jgi:flavin-dependent dehydrogenase